LTECAGGEPSVALDRAGIAIFRNNTFLAAGPATDPERSGFEPSPPQLVGDIAFAHPLEQQLARGLREACGNSAVGSDISQSQGFADVESALESYLPAVFREVYSFWKYESLDGVFHELALMTAPRQAEIAGLCILISDQTLTPYHVQLRVASEVDEIEWLDCRLGEIRDGAMVRIPYNSTRGRGRVVADRLESIEWQFHVGFGNVDVKT
jgi:hypothetical protein